MKQRIAILIINLLGAFAIQAAPASGIDFNTDLLDVTDRENIDFEQFTHVGYIVPGKYTMQVNINDRSLGEREITVKSDADGASISCIPKTLLEEFGLKESALQKVLQANTDMQCINLDVLEGSTLRPDISSYTLTISIPQTNLEYIDDNWEPISRWDNGINGFMLDYGINLQHATSSEQWENNTNASAYGVLGANYGAWRVRADWQAQYQSNRGWHTQKLPQDEDQQDQDEPQDPTHPKQVKETHQQHSADVTRVYAYRPLPSREEKLMVGELDLGNSIFDSFRFTGLTLASDDNMLPPNLRGYAPEVVGIAKTNAKVVISQGGRVLYETQVAAGPFRIQDLNSATSGELDVRVEEQDGSLQTFKVNTAAIPYLSRPGSVRYKFASGKPSNLDHSLEGPLFVSGEASWGVNNGWSLFGGALVSDGYAALTVGTGRDLLQFGAISFDMTESRAELPEKGIKHGGSYRVNYSKSFDKYDSQVAFAGYRFSERDFMTMSDYLSAKDESQAYYQGGSKEMYSVILSKQFRNQNIGAYFDYTHQSYWLKPDSERISLALSHQFDVKDWHGLGLTVNAYRQTQWENADTGMYLSLSVPLGGGSHLGYSLSSQNDTLTHSANYYNTLDERNNYSLSASTSPRGESLSGFYSHTADKAQLSVNASEQNGGKNLSAGLSVQGGITATAQGTALHRVGMMGGSRLLVDADGAEGVPIHAGGPVTTTDRHGKAVVADLTSYYRQRTSIDVDRLGDEVEPIGSPVASRTLTEGAIGYQHFDVLAGGKRLLAFRLQSGKTPPFAAVVENRQQLRLGMLSDDGMAYLAGLHAGEPIFIRWGDHAHCQAVLPNPLPAEDELPTLSCH